MVASSAFLSAALSVAFPERFIASASTIIAVYACVANWSGSEPYFSLKALTKSTFVLSVDALFQAVPTIMFGAAAPAAVITAGELKPFEPMTRRPCGNCLPTSISTFEAVPASPDARIASGVSPLAWVTKAEKSTSAVLYGIVRAIVIPLSPAAFLKISAPSAANF